VIVNVCPAAEIVPERSGPVFDAAEYWTVPLPLPVAPLTIDNQGALLLAAQPHPLAARTSNVPVPPAAVVEAEFDDSENVQPWP